MSGVKQSLFLLLTSIELTIDSIIAEYRPLCLQALETFLPREFTAEGIERFFGEPLYGYDLDSATKSLLVPIWDLLDRGCNSVHYVLISSRRQGLAPNFDVLGR